MINVKNILIGWYRYIFQKMNKQAQERYEICKSCDKNIHNWCSSCGCYLLAKCRVESEKCLDNKWMN